MNRERPNTPLQREEPVTAIASLAAGKSRLAAFVDSLEATHERVVITSHGEPSAVLVSPADLESLEETIALLSDSDATAEINKSRRGIARGEVVDVEAVRLRPRT